MAGEIPVSGDPLKVFNWPALFPRTIISKIGGQVPTEFKDLDSINQFMKSLELKSPEKLLNEAKRIVDGGAELVESNLVAEIKGFENAMVVKIKDKPQERRPGLGLARKRASFSLKASVRRPLVEIQNMEIDKLQDPDEFFDAYDRLENAKKEMQKQLGGNLDAFDQQRPSLVHQRRPGILGKSYVHRYTAPRIETDDTAKPFQETGELIKSITIKDQSLETNSFSVVDDQTGKEMNRNLSNLSDEDSEEDVDLNLLQERMNTISPDFEDQDAPLGAGKAMDRNLSNILDELLSCNNEDLDGDGALYLLQERLNVKPLDLDSLSIPVLNVARSSALTLNNSARSEKVPAPVGHKQNVSAVLSTSKSPFSSLASLVQRMMKPRSWKSPLSFSKDEDDHHAPLGSPAAQSEDETAAPDEGDAPRTLDDMSDVSDHIVDGDASLENAVSYSDLDLDPVEPMNDDLISGDAAVEDDSEKEEVIMEDKSSQNPVDSELQTDQEMPPRPSKKVGKKRGKETLKRGKSLADYGTSFEDGLRRSKRIRMRPLEYWKGERFVYSRIDSSVKLIGVKYLSPGNGNARMKVKPLVASESPSSKVQELIEMAARY